MGRVFKVYLDSNRVFRCRECKAHLTSVEEIISKNFQGRSGKAYLFDKVVNVTTGPPEERVLMTGLHVVVDVYCNACWSPLGWKYEDAEDEKEKYKIGKYVLELAKTHRGD
ncbi:hypothetical protein Poli38472_009921 [Pythium oligandrum]|uniref:Protein yippee-like n=1 Tax=Pythium oligandrum TaxID=41045 RepID=A0A8K1C9D9_PYTOL|nr:hypothetical protein Poli38472_009921 [Pythium oligandrum]|eukprot:TMW58362.1 hypothetical protein Poli38472_009921 [Pythium oligandrum]